MSAAAALALIVGLLTVTGCGSSGEAAPPPLTKAQRAARQAFVAKADRFCERARVEGERKGVFVFEAKARYYKRKGILEQYRGPIKRQELATVLAPSLHRRVAELRRLEAPPRDARQVERILAAIKDAALAAAENPWEFLANGTLGPARQLARAYGIESCAVLYTPDGVFQRVSASPGARLTPRSSK